MTSGPGRQAGTRRPGHNAPRRLSSWGIAMPKRPLLLALSYPTPPEPDLRNFAILAGLHLAAAPVT
jgi:hypothetical protein